MKTSYIFQHITVAIQLIKTAPENLSTIEEDISVFFQQIKDIGGKQKRNTEQITFILHDICHSMDYSD